MKMVAAAKLRKAQDAVTQLRPYAEKLTEILSAMSNTLAADENNPYIMPREPEKVLLVVVTSNKGLCGNFNSTVIKKVVSLANGEYGKQKANNTLDLLIIGKKANDFFRKRDYPIFKSMDDLIDKVNYKDTSGLGDELIELYMSHEYDRIDLVYNQFINAAVQRLIHERFLPMDLKEPEEEVVKTTFVDYIFEPSREELVKELIPKNLRLQVHKALLDSSASEHGARMTAMHQATDNATELLKELRLDYNKARQASITNEILEIVSGANALEG
jgi:F-type H+-transporting ATPase subunit gamma